mmetsp:Transcript_35180/g.53983  ORF Transcript_35180/g.53983 Transcript_35180/m.53983 type:complete len:120 (+) Transcript_35180:350-709(+)
MPGVVGTVVGYSGGKQLNPTYRNIKDHTEAIMIEYDPKIVSFETLLDAWSNMHTPLRNTKTQYRSAIFYLSEDQQKAAERKVAEIQARMSQTIFTSVEPTTRFYRAENYHQHFLANPRY